MFEAIDNVAVGLIPNHHAPSDTAIHDFLTAACEYRTKVVREVSLEIHVLDRVRLFDVSLVDVQSDIDQLATAIGKRS